MTTTAMTEKQYAIYLTKSSQDLVTLVLMLEATSTEKQDILSSVSEAVLYWEGDTRSEFDKTLDGLITMLEVTDEIDLGALAG